VLNFGHGVLHVWNSLPDDVAIAETTNSFKNRLDKLWKYPEIIYDWKEDISGKQEVIAIKVLANINIILKNLPISDNKYTDIGQVSHYLTLSIAQINYCNRG
jgi:hypothetical protein